MQYIKPTNSAKHLIVSGKPGCRKVRLTVRFSGGQKQTTRVSIKTLRKALFSRDSVVAINDGNLLEMKRYRRTNEMGKNETLVCLRFKPVGQSDLVTIRYTELRDALSVIKQQKAIAA